MKIAIDMLASRSAQKDPLLIECADILERAISETRTLSHLLHPPLLDEAGFAPLPVGSLPDFAAQRNSSHPRLACGPATPS